MANVVYPEKPKLPEWKPSDVDCEGRVTVGLMTGCKKVKFMNTENMTYKGVPDLHFIRDGISGFIEMKYTNSLKSIIGLKEDQIEWLLKYATYGGIALCGIWVRDLKRLYVLEDEHLKVLIQQPEMRPQHLKDLEDVKYYSLEKEETWNGFEDWFWRFILDKREQIQQRGNNDANKKTNTA